MAYKNIVQHGSTGKEETFKRIRDFLCSRNGTYDYTGMGPGWTLHDSFYAIDEDNLSYNDWFVLKSDGEDGKQHLYVQFKYISATNFISHFGWAYWDNVTHTGYHQQQATTSSMQAWNTNHDLWIYGDKDFFNVVTSNNLYTTWYCGYYGFIRDSIYDTETAVSALPVSAGVGVEVTLDLIPASWVVGRRVLVRGGLELEWATIQAINGNVLTVNLAYSYFAGCSFSSDGSVMQTTSNTVSSPKVLFDRASAYAIACTSADTFAALGSSSDPDTLMGELMGFPYYVYTATALSQSVFGAVPQLTAGTSVPQYAVYTTPEGVSYRKIFCSAAHFMFKEVSV